MWIQTKSGYVQMRLNTVLDGFGWFCMVFRWFKFTLRPPIVVAIANL